MPARLYDRRQTARTRATKQLGSHSTCTAGRARTVAIAYSNTISMVGMIAGFVRGKRRKVLQAGLQSLLFLIQPAELSGQLSGLPSGSAVAVLYAVLEAEFCC